MRLAQVPVDFVLFALTLAGVALLPRHALRVAVTGLAGVLLYQLAVTGFDTGPGIVGLARHLSHEVVLLANLFALLLGFALLADHFERSGLPALLPNILPDDWKGGFVLLLLVFVLSSFLDNIAAAIIGGTVASSVFRGRVHVGYLAAIVAASNAGGSGSVVGDTTTTMMWIAGVAPAVVFRAYVAAIVAVLVCGVPAALQQQRFSPITRSAPVGLTIDRVRIGIVALILIAAITSNIVVNIRFPKVAQYFPVIGAAVWMALLVSAPLRTPRWNILPAAARNAAFLLCLVTIASLMPVSSLPRATWLTTGTLGFVSAAFDNIPLTRLALEQGGCDWGFLAYAVGFGGSMIWFGSSAGVALVNSFPAARSVSRWLLEGWHVVVAYVAGFAAMLAVLGWAP